MENPDRLVVNLYEKKPALHPVKKEAVKALSALVTPAAKVSDKKPEIPEVKSPEKAPPPSVPIAKKETAPSPSPAKVLKPETPQIRSKPVKKPETMSKPGKMPTQTPTPPAKASKPETLQARSKPAKKPETISKPGKVLTLARAPRAAMASKQKPLPAAKPVKKAESPAKPAKAERIEKKPSTQIMKPEADLLTLNFYQANIRELLSALALQRELNIVIDKEVTGNVSVLLYKRTLAQALDAITLAGGFAYTKYEDVYFFFKPKEKRDPQAKRLKMRIFRLKYAEVDKVQEILDAIPGMRMIKVHEPSKTLIVEDTPENIEKIETLLGYWDAKPKQVMIEAKILEVSLTDDMSFGINWQKLLGDATFGSAGFSTATLPIAQGTSPLPTQTGSGIFGNIITGAGSTAQFVAALDALRSRTNVNTLSTPKILAIHGNAARVQVGGQQGYKVTTTNLGIATESINFINTGTILEITPYIDDEGNVMLNVQPSINSAVIEGGIPVVKSTTVSTWLLARDGETVFMGGLIQNTKTQTKEMIPCLGSIPGLGVLFGRTVQDTGKSELVVLITPTIISTEEDRNQDIIDKALEIERTLEKGTKSAGKEFINNLLNVQ